MKNATQIITSLQYKPQFSKLNKFKCIDKIQSMFMPSFTRFVKFAYIQNNTLFFVLNHNAGKQEFNNNVQTIKSALNFHMPKECCEILVTDIKTDVGAMLVINEKEASKYFDFSQSRIIEIDEENARKIKKELLKERVNKWLEEYRRKKRKA